MTEPYNATLETLRHSRRVDELMLQLIAAIQARLCVHDLSKMRAPEAATFREHSPRLAATSYGSDEYYQQLDEMGDAIAHHHAANRHHPEWHKRGVDGMTLVDLAEMLADWKAAGERHDDGNMARSLAIGTQRFGISDQLASVLENTAREAGWL